MPSIEPGHGDTSLTRAKSSERTRLRLLDAAEKVFGELGFHDASIVDITTAAGVAQGTFYFHFQSKVELFRELLQTRRGELQDVTRAAANRHDGGREMVHAAFKAFFDWVAKHSAIFGVVREAEFVDRSLVDDLYRRHAKEQEEGLARSLAAGRLRPIDPEIVSWCLVGMAEATALRWIVWEGGTPLPPDRLDAFVDTAMRTMAFDAEAEAPA